MSHTVKSKIELKNAAALRAAVEKMGGQYLGHGSAQLYDGATVTGNRFTLPGWHYPLTAEASGHLAYDDYNGQWGNPNDIPRLTGHYAIEAARAEAAAQCWMSEDKPDGSLLIYHPDGGTLTVTPAGSIDAAGFIGSSCSSASEPIARAIGTPNSETRKEEYNQLRQEINTTD